MHTKSCLFTILNLTFTLITLIASLPSTSAGPIFSSNLNKRQLTANVLKIKNCDALKTTILTRAFEQALDLAKNAADSITRADGNTTVARQKYIYSSTLSTSSLAMKIYQGYSSLSKSAVFHCATHADCVAIEKIQNPDGK